MPMSSRDLRSPRAASGVVGPGGGTAMSAYEVLLEEITAIEAVRVALPSDTHIRTLCELTVRRLWAHAEAISIGALPARQARPVRPPK